MFAKHVADSHEPDSAEHDDNGRSRHDPPPMVPASGPHGAPLHGPSRAGAQGHFRIETELGAQCELVDLVDLVERRTRQRALGDHQVVRMFIVGQAFGEKDLQRTEVERGPLG